MRAMEMAVTMELYDPGRGCIGEEEILARHIRLAEMLEGKRLPDWFDLETFFFAPQNPGIYTKGIRIFVCKMRFTCLCYNISSILWKQFQQRNKRICKHSKM